MGQPQWSPVEALRAAFRELRAIATSLDRSTHALTQAVDAGLCPSEHRDTACEAGDLVRVEMRRVVAVMTGSFDYWGLPDAECPDAAPGAAERAAAAIRVAEKRWKNRPRAAVRTEDTSRQRGWRDAWWTRIEAVPVG
ncbi:hypothetical protein [Azospirillum melinis]